MSAGYVVKLRGTPIGWRAYACPEHGAFEVEVDLATSGTPRPCPECGAASERTIAAVLYKPQRGTLVRGKYEGPSRPMDLDTRALADGMSPKEFKKQRAAKWFAHDMDQAKRKGLA